MAVSQLASKARTNAVDASILAPFQSLLTKTYGKPVTVNFTPLAEPHLDVDILASAIAQRLRDRSLNSMRALRQAVRRAKVPDPQSPSTPTVAQHMVGIAPKKEATHELAKRRTTLSEVLKSLQLNKVTSLRVEASGRLSRRLAANRAQSKIAAKGTTNKGPGPIVHGVRKAHVQSAQSSGKRRIGAYGIKARIGTSTSSSPALIGQEWSTAGYSFNKQNLKTAPIVRVNADKLLNNYVTVVARKASAGAAMNALRKRPDKLYVSSIKAQDYGNRVVLNAFVYDGREKELARKRIVRRAAPAGASTGGVPQAA